MENPEESAVNEGTFPEGRSIRSSLPTHAVGNLLEVHEFFCHFKDVLKLEEPLSIEDLEKELACTEPYGDEPILGTTEINLTGLMSDKCTSVLISRLPQLVSKLLANIGSAAQVKLDMLPINQLTWPEVVRRYIMAYLLVEGKMHSQHKKRHNKTNIVRCLLGDGGIFCDSPTVVAGVELDAKLLGCAVSNIFGKPNKERNALSMGIEDGIDPEWVTALKPALSLPTNVGSRIRSCVHEALKKDPPEWAKKELENSIAKDVYKGNASGPTKVKFHYTVLPSCKFSSHILIHDILVIWLVYGFVLSSFIVGSYNAVREVIKRAEKNAPRAPDVPQRLSPPPVTDARRKSELISKVIMKKCHRILCHVSAIDTEKVLSDLVGGIFNSEDKNLWVIFKSKSTRPLDLRTIKSRFLHGTYGDSHEAFLEDFREAENSLLLWINLVKGRKDRSSLENLADDMSKYFNSLYNMEVAPLVRSLLRDNNIEVTVEVEKLEDLSSIAFPKTPWEMGICKVCCIDKDDDMVLLCDVCDAEYHTYCLNPPLSVIPNGNWHCPTCSHSDEPEGRQQIFQFVDLKLEEASRFNDYLTASEAKEYMELEADKKIFLLKFLCDESLYTDDVREYLNESRREAAISFLGSDSAERLYWGFPHTSTHCGIVVYQNAVLENTGLTSHAPPRNEDYSSWSVFQSHEQIDNLVVYLLRNDPKKKHLRDSISKWQTTMLHNGEQNGKNLLESHAARSSKTKSSRLLYCLNTKATELLKSKYELQLERYVGTSSKRQRKCLTEWHRCRCLEPVFHSRFHCSKCHKTFFSNNELLRHKISPCNRLRSSDNVSSSEITSSSLAPKASQKPLAGKALHTLKQLKINLLDMEAALPDRARRTSRASAECRSAWCEYVKSADTIYQANEIVLFALQMVEATLVLETMIKTEYINNSWWWCWSSVSVAAKISTTSALAFRIYSLDAAIDYEKQAATLKKKPTEKKRHI
ncbi:methyl-CpG-binding domain-containing protein 9-like protein [Tanacetum coccineum]